jgi:hypothetical protein
MLILKFDRGFWILCFDLLCCNAACVSDREGSSCTLNRRYAALLLSAIPCSAIAMLRYAEMSRDWTYAMLVPKTHECLNSVEAGIAIC